MCRPNSRLSLTRLGSPAKVGGFEMFGAVAHTPLRLLRHTLSLVYRWARVRRQLRLRRWRKYLLRMRVMAALQDALDRAKERLYGRRDGFGEACAWHPEYGAWMVEGTPRFPYSGFTADLRRVETNMIQP